MTSEFYFGTYYRCGGGKHYVWVCVKCGYVYEAIDGSIRGTLKFLKNHTCPPKHIEETRFHKKGSREKRWKKEVEDIGLAYGYELPFTFHHQITKIFGLNKNRQVIKVRLKVRKGAILIERVK